ncbi:zinc-binding loop region of homing endonuclease-domain-containing protein [Lipomyces tetrasporus]
MGAARLLELINQEKANYIIISRRVKITDLGCWESNARPTNRGYITVSVAIGGESGSLKLHQIALIADNRRDELNATLGDSGYDISHLCHNGKCFNPAHLIAESSVNNQRRKICSGQRILIHDGFSYHPCPHGRVEKLCKCILPLHRLEGNTPDFEEQTSAVATAYPYTDEIVTVNDDATTNKYDMITPTMAQGLIDRYRGDTTELGCWQSKRKADGNMSPKVILKELPVRPRLNQVALIATNRRDELKKALGHVRYCAISQLCHNIVCINPEHIIVESISNNHKRKTCIGKTAIVRDGVTYHACPHGSVEKMRTCILPVEQN